MRAVVLGASLCLALVGVRFIVAPRHAPASTPSSQTNAGVAAATSTGAGDGLTNAPPPAVVPSTILLKLDASPSDAVIIIDDDAPLAVPFEARMPKDGREHRVRIEAAGYAPRVETVTFANDFTAFVALERVQSKAVVGSRKPNAPLTSHGDEPAPAPVAAPHPASTGESKPGSIHERPDGRPAKHDRLNTKLDPSDPW